MTGDSVNQYRMTASIGAGGMGEVFRARSVAERDPYCIWFKVDPALDILRAEPRFLRKPTRLPGATIVVSCTTGARRRGRKSLRRKPRRNG